MDGVLCNFERGCELAYNEPWYPNLHVRCNHKDPAIADQFWLEMYDRKPDFWETLPWMPGGQTLWKGLIGIPVQILTALPDVAMRAEHGKRVWCATHLTPQPRTVHVVQRPQKKQFALNPYGEPNILIDDYVKNVKEWWKAGGIAIHHDHNDPEGSLALLEQFLSI